VVFFNAKVRKGLFDEFSAVIFITPLPHLIPEIKSPPLIRGGLGWGQTIFDTLIIIRYV
jgi:hypothetical protein